MEWLRLAAISVSANDVGLPTSTSTLSDAIANIIKLLMGLIGSAAVIFIIVGAIEIIASNGEPKRYNRGRETLLYAIIGVIVSIAAYGAVSFIADRIK